MPALVAVGAANQAAFVTSEGCLCLLRTYFASKRRSWGLAILDVELVVLVVAMFVEFCKATLAAE